MDTNVSEAPTTDVATDVDAEDTLIVERCVNGDPRGFARLYEKYSPLLTNVLRRMLGTKKPERIEDVVQDVFVRLMEKTERFTSFRGDSKLSTWLVRIAINTATTNVKKYKRTPDAERLAEVRVTTETAPAFTPAISAESVQKIEAALAQVPDHLRKFILPLVKDDSLSYEEIGAILGCSVGDVRSGLQYARRKVRANLGA